jgi:hypothetical protein
MDSEIRASRILEALCARFGLRRKLAGLLQEPALPRAFLRATCAATTSSGPVCEHFDLSRRQAAARVPTLARYLRNGSLRFRGRSEPSGRARSARWDLCGRSTPITRVRRRSPRESASASHNPRVSFVDIERDPGGGWDGWRLSVRREREKAAGEAVRVYGKIKSHLTSSASPRRIWGSREARLFHGTSPPESGRAARAASPGVRAGHLSKCPGAVSRVPILSMLPAQGLHVNITASAAVIATARPDRHQRGRWSLAGSAHGYHITRPLSRA